MHNISNSPLPQTTKIFFMNTIDTVAALLPDESQGNDVVRVDRDKPVTVFAVWIGMWVVGRKDES